MFGLFKKKQNEKEPIFELDVHVPVASLSLICNMCHEIEVGSLMIGVPKDSMGRVSIFKGVFELTVTIYEESGVLIRRYLIENVSIEYLSKCWEIHYGTNDLHTVLQEMKERSIYRVSVFKP